MSAWVLLIRHASAGSRRKWPGPDELRPLDKKGRRQAESLTDSLPRALGLQLQDIGRVLSSPYLRCVETVQPLARSIDTEVRKEAGLAEGHEDRAAALFWSEVQRTGSGDADSAALCTHGDIVPFLLDEVAETGVELGRAPTCPKGSVWAFEVRGSAVISARYVAPALDRRTIDTFQRAPSTRRGPARSIQEG